MPAIADIGTEVQVTPSDEVQVVRGPHEHEFIDDRSPFCVRVSGILEESGQLVGVFGEVISGHERYRHQTATLLVRLDHSDWSRDNRSAANFKVGRGVARPNGKLPAHHPEGTDISGYPYLMRYGSLDCRRCSEPEVNSAVSSSHPGGAEPGA